jgi:hypothetical protein
VGSSIWVHPYGFICTASVLEPESGEIGRQWSV